MSVLYNILPNTALTPYPLILSAVVYALNNISNLAFFISLIHQREFHEQKLNIISFTSRSLAEVCVVIVKDLYSTWYLTVYYVTLVYLCKRNVGYSRIHILNVGNFAMIRKYIYDFYTHIFSMPCQFSRNNLFYDEVWAGDGI